MRKNALLFLLTPLIFSCNKLYVVNKSDALNIINNLYKNYETLDNIPLDMVISNTHNKDKHQYAYDSKDKLFYEYIKSDNSVLKSWQYFEDKTLISLEELDKDGSVTKIKYKDTSISDTNDVYFKKVFKSIIDENINKLKDIYKQELKKEEYHSHGKDLIIDINYDEHINNIVIENNSFSSCSYKVVDSDNKVIDTNEYTFSYGNFVTTVNPDEFLEV